MTLTLYNTRTRTKSVFRRLDASRPVRMYVCGPTVYSFAHIGNARAVIVFDALYRLLRHIYGPANVLYVRNITDVDDKINRRAQEEGVTIRELTEITARQFREDMAALGALPPDIEPRATDHIDAMKAMIERLLARGCAYVAEDHVLFDVSAMPDYGELSGRSLEEMEAGARVEVAPYKKNPMDFVLWKPSRKGEPSWPSPGGVTTPGRPGWHIECSAMSAQHLGETFDIHGGGVDLVFPHHENETAQSRCAHGTPFMANFWLHNGFLQVEGDKMSKSLGNVVTPHDLLKECPGEAIRLALLTSHYRQPMNWTARGMTEARRALDHWYELTVDVEAEAAGVAPGAEVTSPLCDDLNTPKAIAALHELRAEAARGDRTAARRLKAGAQLLGLLQLSAAEWAAWRPAVAAGLDKARVSALIGARQAARAARNWPEADRIRKELAAMGVALKDAKDPRTGELVTTWELAR